METGDITPTISSPIVSIMLPVLSMVVVLSTALR